MKGAKDGPKWGNWIGYVVLPIPIALYSDPLDYIRKGMEITNRKKNSWEAFFTYWSADLIVKVFGLKVFYASLIYSFILFFFSSLYYISNI